MRKRPGSVKALEELGRVRLSETFFMRDFLHSEIAGFYGLANIPDDPDLAVAAGTRLCEEILEPIRAELGRISIRSAFRSAEVNRFGNENGFNCGRNETNFGGHIWDRRDAGGAALRGQPAGDQPAQSDRGSRRSGGVRDHRHGERGAGRRVQAGGASRVGDAGG